MSMQILHGDSAEKLLVLPAGSFHMCVTSPPYDDLRTYQNGSGVRWDFELTALQLHRVLCDGGVLCWVVNDQVVDGGETLTSCKQKIFFVEKCGFRVHDTMIYQKRNFSHPERTRYHQVFEYVFVLSKGAPRVFRPLKDRKNLTAGCIGNLGVNTFTERDGSKSVRSKKVTAEFGMRHNVWLGNTRGQEEMCEPLKHPAMMPKWLARDLILSWSNPGDRVIDPFGGSGTTGLACKETGRECTLIDNNAQYVEMMRATLDGHAESDTAAPHPKSGG